MRRCFLNNYMLENNRRSAAYQGVIIDLYLIGVITKDKVKKLIGYDVPDYLHLTDFGKDPKPTDPKPTDPKPAVTEDEDEDEDE